MRQRTLTTALTSGAFPLDLPSETPATKPRSPDHRVAPVMTMLVIPHGLFPETFGPGAATLPEMRADMAKRDAARSEREATARWWQTAILAAAFGVALGAADLLKPTIGVARFD